MIKQKLTSRKLWIGVAVIVIGVVLCFTGYPEEGRNLIMIGIGGYLGAETICDVIRGIWSSKDSENADEETEEIENG